MTAHYLRASSQADMGVALAAAGLAPGTADPMSFRPPFGVSTIDIGIISIDTGQTETVEIDGVDVEQPVFETLPGWHANVYGTLTPEQLALLPVVDPPPKTPHVTLWT